MKFYLHPDLQVQECSKIKDMLNDNGGEVVQDRADENVIYIVDSFDENHLNMIDELQNRGVRIISTKCIYETLMTNKPLPTINYPLYSRCLEGKIVALDYNIDENARNHLAKLTRFMGGELSDNVTSKTDYLLSNKVGSIFYKVAAHHYGVEILLPNWITDCWDKQQFLPTTHYKILPFTGCTISVTGILSPKRKKIQDLTTKFGGEYSPDLTRKCTHLLSEQPRGLKYTYARDWGIHCVRTAWFYDSIKKKICQDETAYYLPEPSKRDLSLSVNNYHELNRLSPTLRKKHIQKNPSSRYGLVVITNSPKFRPTIGEMNVEQERRNLFSDINIKDIFNDKDNLKNEIMSLIEKMKSNEEVHDTIQKLINYCDKLINHYQNLSEKDKEHLKEILDKYSNKK
jgi:hypothetical protein